MNKRFLVTSLAILAIAGFFMSGSVGTQSVADVVPPEAEPPELDVQLFETPNLQRVTPLRAAPSTNFPLSPAGPVWEWISQGPGPILNGQLEHIPGNNPVTGAVHTVVAHPTNADILYLGGVNGGIWRTTNATAASPNWTPLTDHFPSLSIGALEMDPTDATNQTLVGGTGLYSNFGNRGGPRAGLLRTTDGGNTWTQLGEVDLAGRNISGVGPRGNTILVSVNTGVGPGMYRSTDGGATFQFISGINGLNVGAAFDLVGDPSDPDRFYTGVGGATGGVFRTDDAGASWTDVTDAAIAALVSGATNNIELAVHNNTAAGTNAVYVAIVNNGRLAGILRSANMGGTWTAMDLPQTMEAGNPEGIHPGGQGGNNLSIVADPIDQDIVYVGGDRQPGPLPNSIGATDWTGRLFRGDASIAPTGGVPSPQWTPLTHVGTASSSAPHADSREMVFDANGDIIQGDDGGIYRRTSPTSVAGDWESVNGDLQVTEFHDIAYDTNSDIIIGGAQDTGTPQQITPGGTTWDSVSTADGGDVAVDNISLAGVGQSIRYSSFQFLGSFRRRTYDAANTFISQDFPALTVVAGAALVTQFKTPVELNAIDPTRLIIGGGNSTYESDDQGDTITEVGPGINVNRPGAIAYGGRSGGVDNPDVLYVGSGNQVFIRTVAGGLLNASSALPAGAGLVRDIVLDPDEWMNAYVVDNNQVFFTDDAGVTWTDITGNLTDANLRTVVFVPAGVDIVLAGGESGVFAMRTNTPGYWAEVGTGLPEAPVYDLDYDEADDVLVAGLLGRGAWLLPGVSVNVNLPPICDAGGPYEAECGGATTNVTLDGTGSSDPDPGDILSYWWATDCPNGSFDDPTSPTPTLTVDTSPGCSLVCGITLTVTDSAGASSSCSTTVTIVDTTPPVITCPADIRIECDQPTDPENTGFATATDVCDPAPAIDYSDEIISGECPGAFVIRRTWTATDACGNVSSCVQAIEVVDTTPPEITVLSVDPDNLWPANHKMVDVGLTYRVSDNCDPDPTISIQVTSDEPTATAPGAGGARHAPDAKITGEGGVLLRAERSGKGDGRVYVITLTATDECGNSTSSGVSVKVNHNKKKGAIDSGQNYDATQIN